MCERIVTGFAFRCLADNADKADKAGRMKSPKGGFQPGENDEGDNKTTSPVRQLEHRQLPDH